MMGLRFGCNASPTVLLVGAHADDIEIGCSATMIQLLRSYPAARIVWVVLSANATRKREAAAGARAVLGRTKNARILIEAFRESYFPAQFTELKDFFEGLRGGCEPDLIFSHWRQDAHQDHRIVGDLIWNTFRSHLILEYEIPKYEGDLGHPACFVPASRALVDRKLRLLHRSFPSQQTKAWFSPSTFEGLMRIRGLECQAPSGYAEAFHGRKLLLELA